MKNIFKVLSIIAMVALIAFSFVSCEDEDPGNDGVQKSLVITGIPTDTLNTSATATTDVKGKQLTVALCNQKGGATGKGKGDFELYAFNQITIPGTSPGATGATIEIALISATTKVQFTGTGQYYVLLYFDTSDTPTDLSDDITYSYTAQAGGTVPLTINITEDKTTLEFNKFTILQ